MNEFCINNESKPNLTDEGVSVRDLLSLLDENDALSNALLKALEINSVIDDFISITGAQKLVTIQKNINEKFYKEDFKSSLNDLDFFVDENKFMLKFSNLCKSSYLSRLGLESINSTLIYSSKSDFFSWFYAMDKYANELIKSGLSDILNYNLDLFRQKKIGTKERKYRILHDLKNNMFYVRAITSLDRYNNYDNNITIVVGLISLHKKSKFSKQLFSINRIEYNESYIRIYFEENCEKELEGIGTVKNLIEVSNDEVKREALKFDAVSNIKFIDSNNKLQEIIIQPSSSIHPKFRTNILSIAHSLSPNKFIEKLNDIENSTIIHDKLFKLIETVSEIKDHNQILFLVKEIVKNARHESFKQYRNKVQKIIEQSFVRNLIDLLTLFKKIELVTENDIEASEYVRYLIYQSLIERKKQ